MKKKTQKNRVFIAAIGMLLISAVVITTASWAWFTLGKNATVSDIDLKVTAKEGIQISANTQDWTSTLTFADLNGDADAAYPAYAGNTNNFPKVIKPVSSRFTASGSTFPAFFEGGIDVDADLGGKAMTATAVTLAESRENALKPGYYAFDVFVNYPGAESSITVNVGASKVTVKNDTDGTVANNNIENAMRIGFVNCGVVAASSPASANASETLVYNSKDTDLSATEAITSAGKSAALVDGTYTVTAANRGTIGLANYSNSTNQASTAQLTLNGGINRVRVYIWMEGQDALCTDDLASQLVGASLVFEMV